MSSGYNIAPSLPLAHPFSFSNFYEIFFLLFVFRRKLFNIILLCFINKMTTTMPPMHTKQGIIFTKMKGPKIVFLKTNRYGRFSIHDYFCYLTIWLVSIYILISRLLVGPACLPTQPIYFTVCPLPKKVVATYPPINTRQTGQKKLYRLGQILPPPSCFFCCEWVPSATFYYMWTNSEAQTNQLST